MKKLKSFFSKRIIYIILGLITIALGLVAFIKITIKDNKVYIINKIDYGWSVSLKDTTIENISLANYSFNDFKKGDTIIAKKTLKQTKKDKEIIYPILDIKTENCLIDIYFDGKKIAGNYNNKNDNYVSIKRNYTAWLPDNYDGKELKIIFSLQQNGATSILKNITIMSENDYFNHQIRSNLTNYIVSSIIIILGIILTLSSLCMPQKANRLTRLFWIGLIFFFAGISMYAKYNILELFINNSRTIENVEYSGLYLCMPCIVMLAYYAFQDKERKRFLCIYNIILVLTFVLTVSLNNIGAISYRDSLSAITIIMYITAIVLLVLNLKTYKNIDKTEKIFMIGMDIFYCQSMITILLSKVLSAYSWHKYEQAFIILLILEFFITTILYYAYVVKEYMSNITEQRILTTLAYTDSLTGINNRTKFEEYISELSKNNAKNITVFSFDLNNLKKINDTKGHEAGDIYIKSFATTLKKVFELDSFIGRIGGDEFIAIIEDTTIDINKYIDKMQKVFTEKTEKENIDFEASFAYGTSNSNTDKVTVIKDLINLSDKRMYTCKKEQKIGRD